MIRPPTGAPAGKSSAADSLRKSRRAIVKGAFRSKARFRHMFRVKLTNFRCFAETPSLEVLPVTFLVGENSAGKTTFLAAVRLLLESFSRPSENPFNRDPYYLGGFDQIAHYHGGSPGRAKTFSLQLDIPAVGSQRPAASHIFAFVKGGPQPELVKYDFMSGDVSVEIKLVDEKPKLTIKKGNTELATVIPAEAMPPSVLFRKDPSFVRYILDDFLYRPVRHAANDDNLEAKELLEIVKLVVDRFRQSIRHLVMKTFASAPVRTQPQRTYTPSEVVASSEGSHVPLEMARQKTGAPQEWKAVHEKLSEFGKHSGLFDDINIRLLGTHDGDPFQVLVRTKGPPFNLVDVGYGVSQALPIIYQLELPTNEHNAMLLQQPEVHLHPRAQAELGSLIARLSAKRKQRALYMVETHSDYIIDRVRMEVAAGKLDHRQVTIIFFEKVKHEVRATNIYISEKGDILNPPENFRSFFLEEHSRLLGM
jgi:hypothetical protein